METSRKGEFEKENTLNIRKTLVRTLNDLDMNMELPFPL